MPDTSLPVPKQKSLYCKVGLRFWSAHISFSEICREEHGECGRSDIWGSKRSVINVSLHYEDSSYLWWFFWNCSTVCMFCPRPPPKKRYSVHVDFLWLQELDMLLKALWDVSFGWWWRRSFKQQLFHFPKLSFVPFLPSLSEMLLPSSC